MTVHSKVSPDLFTTLDVDHAASFLEHLLENASEEERIEVTSRLRGLLGEMKRDYPILSRDYPHDFVPSLRYRAEMPDLQNGPSSLIRGAHVPIQHVGISNFRLPLNYALRDGSVRSLDTSVIGTVSLEAEKKGINMSRILRSFYSFAEEHFGPDVVSAVLQSYVRDLQSLDARIMLRTALPLQVQSLRSGLMGYQYYTIAYEAVFANGREERIVHVDYVYSSTCPCSLELSEHARERRGQLATPHSQRSVARLSVKQVPGETLWVEDIIDLCRAAVPTETQVMVKREDEQAFAELNAANPIFVEDAARLFYEQLSKHPAIGDFRVAASHQESLHSHDAVSVIARGDSFDSATIDPEFFGSLIHPG